LETSGEGTSSFFHRSFIIVVIAIVSNSPSLDGWMDGCHDELLLFGGQHSSLISPGHQPARIEHPHQSSLSPPHSRDTRIKNTDLDTNPSSLIQKEASTPHDSITTRLQHTTASNYIPYIFQRTAYPTPQVQHLAHNDTYQPRQPYRSYNSKDQGGTIETRDDPTDDPHPFDRRWVESCCLGRDYSVHLLEPFLTLPARLLPLCLSFSQSSTSFRPNETSASSYEVVVVSVDIHRPSPPYQVD
jgi:hypothetical protein